MLQWYIFCRGRSGLSGADILWRQVSETQQWKRRRADWDVWLTESTWHRQFHIIRYKKSELMLIRCRQQRFKVEKCSSITIKTTFNIENFIWGCLGLSSDVLAQFTSEMHTTAWNREKSIKNTPFQSRRLFKVIDDGTVLNLVICVCYDMRRMFMPIFNTFQLDYLIALKGLPRSDAPIWKTPWT